MGLNKNRRIIAVAIICFCWLPQMLYLFPTPQLKYAEYMSGIVEEHSEEKEWIYDTFFENKINLTTYYFYKIMWQGWAIYALIIAFGLFSGLLTYYNRYKWRFCLLSSSLLYLLFWYSKGSSSSVGLVMSYKLKWDIIKKFNGYIAFIYQDFILPILFLIIIVLVIVEFLKQSLSINNSQ